jgi:hypothetical protein
MVARQRFLRFIRPLLAMVVLAVFIGILLPLLARYSSFLRNAHRPKPVIKTVIAILSWLSQWGPCIVGAVLMLAIGLGTLGYFRMTRIHAQYSQGFASQAKRVLLLPRADMPEVKLDRVSLWLRITDLIPFGEHMAFELSGSEQGLAFSMCASEKFLHAALTQVMSEWPGVHALPLKDPEEDPLPSSEGKSAWWVEIGPASTDPPIIPTTPDPLLALMTEIAHLPQGVRGGLQILMRGDPFTRSRLGTRAARLTADTTKTQNLQLKRGAKSLDERAQHMFLETRLVLWASATGQNMAQSVARSLARTLASQFGASNPVRPRGEGTGVLVQRRFPLFVGRPWADNELAAVAHLVGQNARASAPQLRTAPARSLPPAPDCRVPPQARVVVPYTSRPNISMQVAYFAGDHHE